MNKNVQFSKEHAKFLHKLKKDKAIILSTQIFILVAFLAIWEGLGQLGLINTFITSSPSRIWNTFVALLQSGDLWYHMGITLYETLVAFVIATFLGTIIAIALWWKEKKCPLYIWHNTRYLSSWLPFPYRVLPEGQ